MQKPECQRRSNQQRCWHVINLVDTIGLQQSSVCLENLQINSKTVQQQRRDDSLAQRAEAATTLRRQHKIVLSCHLGQWRADYPHKSFETIFLPDAIMLVDLQRPTSHAWGAGKCFSVVRYADCDKSMQVTELSSVSSTDGIERWPLEKKLQCIDFNIDVW